MNENNKVTVMGEIVSEFSFSHEIYGEGFYMVDILVPRLSESADLIPLMVSERLLDVKADYRGMNAKVSGQFRSYNRHEERKNKLVLSVFVRHSIFFHFWQYLDNFLHGYLQFADGNLIGNSFFHLLLRQLSAMRKEKTSWYCLCLSGTGSLSTKWSAAK